MPFTREQQREHYLKNQELLKAKRRERYLANKNQVEQNLKVEQTKDFYDWCLDSCEYFTWWRNQQIKANE